MKNTVSLKLNGDVSLSDFTKVMNHFTNLIELLTSEVGKQAEVDWDIAKLEGGSATAVVIGRSIDEIVVDKIIQAYEIVGQAITENKPIPFSDTIAIEARSITHVINGKIKSIEMRTDEFKTIINSSMVEEISEEEMNYSFGTVIGWVETLSKRGNLRFVLYDTMFDRAVTCYLAKDQEGLMLDAWDKKIAVAGKVYRDLETGRPYQVREVNYIEEKSRSPQGSFMLAQGIIPWVEGDELPEEQIRRYRDAQ